MDLHSGWRIEREFINYKKLQKKIKKVLTDVTYNDIIIKRCECNGKTK